jgi:hypothetical protein
MMVSSLCENALVLCAHAHHMHMHVRFAHYLRAALFAHSPFLRKADVLRIGALTISGRRWPGAGACVAGCTLLQLATDNGDRLIPAGPCVVELLLQHGATACGPRNHCWPLELAVEHWYPITKSCPPEKNPAFDPEHPVLGPEDPSFVPEYELPLCYDQNDQLTFARNGYCADGMICRCHMQKLLQMKRSFACLPPPVHMPIMPRAKCCRLPRSALNGICTCVV